MWGVTPDTEWETTMTATTVQAEVNLIGTCTGMVGTITADLPAAYAPICRDLVGALIAHAVYSGEVVGHGDGAKIRRPAPAMLSLCWAFRAKIRGGVDLGEEIIHRSPEDVERAVSRAVRHLHAHVFGDRPAAECVEPTPYIRRLAAA